MRVLHIIPTLDPRAGGPTTVLAGLAPAQREAGLDVTVLTTWREGEPPDVCAALSERGVPVIRVGPVTGALRRHPLLRHTIEQQVAKSDVAHIHALWEEPQYLAARHAQRTRIPYLITPHGMLDPWSLAQKRWKKKLYIVWRLRHILNRANAVHFMTAMERDACAGLRLKPAQFVQPIGLNLAEFQTIRDRDALRRKMPEVGTNPLILFLGRIHPGKGLEHLVPALARMRQIKAVLVVAGPDSAGFQRTMESKIAECGLQDRVFFTGMLRGDDRIDALAGADLFCMPSDHENLGLAVIESLAAGTPVIISKEVGVWKEVVDAGVGAAPAREPQSLAAELERWLGDNKLRENAAARCRQFVSEHYDLAKIAQRWKQRYELLAGGIPLPAEVL